MQNGQVSLQIHCRRKGNTIQRSEFGLQNQSVLNRNAKTMFPICIFWPVLLPPLGPSPCCDFPPVLLLIPVLFHPKSSGHIFQWKSLLPPSFLSSTSHPRLPTNMMMMMQMRRCLLKCLLYNRDYGKHSIFTMKINPIDR